ncbi:MAG TPA: arginase family protein [Thermoanaerobaculia bacterium]|nr:arginase family protein [Thermoanaerobaculia bacterium]HUM29028.1 arginase family protein [Thermoanaerobaculia bacterium]HXK67416.1 arginase family protein [Thermoanaerobaculia bacterium]
MKVRVFGAPFNSDGTSPREENPAYGLREAGILKYLEREDLTVIDEGDLSVPECDGFRDPDSRILHVSAWKKFSQHLAKETSRLMKKDDFLLILGGDCAILYGIIAGLALLDRKPGLVYFDAHADCRMPDLSPSGEAAELITTLLTGRGPAKSHLWPGHFPLLDDSDIVIAGIRERDLVDRTSIAVLDRARMKMDGVEVAAERALDFLSNKNENIWLHFDVDVLDPRLVPVCFPELDGLSFDEAETFMKIILCSGRVLGMDVTCYHPRMDSNLKAGIQISNLLSRAIGTLRH